MEWESNEYICAQEFGAENFVARQDVLGGTAAHLKFVVLGLWWCHAAM